MKLFCRRKWNDTHWNTTSLCYIHIKAAVQYTFRHRLHSPLHLTLIIIIIIALKGANWDFWQSPLCATNRLQHVHSSGPGRNRLQITCNTLSAYHVQHVSRATWYEGTAQLLRLTESKSHLFELYFIGWTSNWWRRGGNRSTRRKPLATSFRK